MTKKVSLQNNFLGTIRDSGLPVSLYLKSGIKLEGRLVSFDQFVLTIKGNRSDYEQVIYKHAISTVVPPEKVRISYE